MANSMKHWNGNQLCIIDTETTGLDPHYHEIIQLAILAVDSNIRPRKDVLPFNIRIRPDHPERVDPKAMALNKLQFNEVGKSGFDREKAKEVFFEWYDKLKLPLRVRSSYPCKVIPGGHNFVAFDLQFIKQWLTPEVYDDTFHYHPRDTMISGLYANDRAAMHAEKVPYSKLSLSWMCKIHGIEVEKAHDALQDCVATAKLMRAMLFHGTLV